MERGFSYQNDSGRHSPNGLNFLQLKLAQIEVCPVQSRPFHSPWLFLNDGDFSIAWSWSAPDAIFFARAWQNLSLSTLLILKCQSDTFKLDRKLFLALDRARFSLLGHQYCIFDVSGVWTKYARALQFSSLDRARLFWLVWQFWKAWLQRA